MRGWAASRTAIIIVGGAPLSYSLIRTGKAKLSQYQSFVDVLHGGQLEETERQYGSFIEELKGFLERLAEGD